MDKKVKNITLAIVLIILVISICCCFLYTIIFWQPWQIKGTITGTVLDKDGLQPLFRPPLSSDEYYMKFTLENYTFTGTTITVNNGTISFDDFADCYWDIKIGKTYTFYYHTDCEYNELSGETKELVYFDNVKLIN